MSGQPDPTNPDLLDNLRLYLATQGIARVPRDGTNPSLPPLWLAPKYGTPTPGQTEGLNPVEVGNTLVASAALATGIPPAPYEGFLRRQAVEFEIISLKADQAYAFENQVRTVLNDKRGWMMASVPVNESLIYRELQPVTSGKLGFVFTLEYMFLLAGPFTPVGP